MVSIDLGRVTGKTAYELAVAGGYSGTESEWLNSLKGKTAYELAVAGGYSGTESEWLNSLKYHVNNKTVSLTVAGWSNLQQHVSVSGVTASNTVFVSPDPASTVEWGVSGVYASEQTAGKITFTCEKVPTAALTANVVIFD